MTYKVKLGFSESLTPQEVRAIRQSFRVTAIDVMKKVQGEFKDDDMTVVHVLDPNPS
jgi:hypothetical protein